MASPSQSFLRLDAPPEFSGAVVEEHGHEELLEPIAEIRAALELDDGLHVEFLQAIPIFASESFKQQRGEATDEAVGSE